MSVLLMYVWNCQAQSEDSICAMQPHTTGSNLHQIDTLDLCDGFMAYTKQGIQI